jgi:hypothetical protein
MNNDARFYDAKRRYLEQYGDPMVTNTYLKIALVLVSLVVLGLAVVELKTIRTFQNFPFIAARMSINPPGRIYLGFVPASRRRVFERLRPLVTPQYPFVNLPETGESRSAQADKITNSCIFSLRFSFLEAS